MVSLLIFIPTWALNIRTEGYDIRYFPFSPARQHTQWFLGQTWWLVEAMPSVRPLAFRARANGGQCETVGVVFIKSMGFTPSPDAAAAVAAAVAVYTIRPSKYQLGMGSDVPRTGRE